MRKLVLVTLIFSLLSTMVVANDTVSKYLVQKPIICVTGDDVNKIYKDITDDGFKMTTQLPSGAGPGISVEIWEAKHGDEKSVYVLEYPEAVGKEEPILCVIVVGQSENWKKPGKG